MSFSPRLSCVRPTPLHLPTFLPYASAQLQAPYHVRVIIQIQEEYVSKADEKSKKTPKRSIILPISSRLRTESQELQDESNSPQPTYGSTEIVVTAVHDSASRLIELCFNRCKEIPRMLMQIVALCVPYQPFLTKLTICWAQLGGEALYEIAKFMRQSKLTDVCLDDSPVLEKNFHSLLEHEPLQRLSLARCCLDDNDCVNIAAKLAHPLPASRNLYVLSLVSNMISDVGACALAEALKSNRTLQHLNLAGNRISDVGACALFHSMAEFPLTYGDLQMKRQRTFQYLQLKKEVYFDCLTKLTAAFLDESSRGGKPRTASSRGRKSCAAVLPSLSTSCGPSMQEDVVALRAAAMTNELIGSYSEPFRVEETVFKEGYIYSLGNRSLCFMNLAYNNLGYMSVVALLNVLQYQGALVRGTKAGSGLLRVVLDGNPMPAACNEYNVIQDLLERVIQGKLITKSSPLMKKTKK